MVNRHLFCHLPPPSSSPACRAPMKPKLFVVPQEESTLSFSSSLKNLETSTRLLLLLLLLVVAFLVGVWLRIQNPSEDSHVSGG